MSRPSRNRNGAVAAALGELSAVRRVTLMLADATSQAALDERPVPDKWSAGEVLDHVLRIERYQCEQIRELIRLARRRRQLVLRRGFAEVDISIAFIPKPIIALFEAPLMTISALVPSSFRELLMKRRWGAAQHPTFSTPKRGRPAAELRRDLEMSLHVTGDLVFRNRELPYERMILEHPLLGRVNVAGILRFLTKHEQGHQGQFLEAVTAHLRTPAVRVPDGGASGRRAAC
jgi:hypothetical protein